MNALSVGFPRREKPSSTAFGYVSSFNTLSLTVDEDVFQGTDIDGMFVWMDNYCRAHPLDLIQYGANALIDELQRRNGAR
jgi:hypothetical protein